MLLSTLLFVLVAPLVLSAAGAPSGWRQSNFSGFGNTANTNISALEVFSGQLYAGTWNNNGAQVWRSVDGSSWSQFMPA